MRVPLRPGDRLHLAVWRVWGAPMGWRAAWAVNGCPIRSPLRFWSHREALAWALAEAKDGFR